METYKTNGWVNNSCADTGEVRAYLKAFSCLELILLREPNPVIVCPPADNKGCVDVRPM